MTNRAEGGGPTPEQMGETAKPEKRGIKVIKPKDQEKAEASSGLNIALEDFEVTPDQELQLDLKKDNVVSFADAVRMKKAQDREKEMGAAVEFKRLFKNE